MAACPTESELLRFARGAVSEVVWTEIAAHLDVCPSCVQRLESLDTPIELAIQAVAARNVSESNRPSAAQTAPQDLHHDSPRFENDPRIVRQLPTVTSPGSDSGQLGHEAVPLETSPTQSQSTNDSDSSGSLSSDSREPVEMLGGWDDNEFRRLAERVLPWAWTAQQLQQAAAESASLEPDENSLRSSAEPDSSESSWGKRLKPGMRLGHYRLLNEIGRGAMGIVYLAEHIPLRRTVAMKCLHPGRRTAPQVMQRFRREMAALGRIDHPNLIRATDAGETDGHPYLAMEYVAGVDIERLAATQGPLSIAAACEIGAQAANGLAHAHQCGLIHRDVKPSNLLLGVDTVVRVLDLGLALEQDPDGSAEGTAADVSSPTAENTGAGFEANRNEADLNTVPLAQATWDQTAAGSLIGTRAYMAPEQRVSSREIDSRADIYGLGAMMIRLLFGFPPSALAEDLQRSQTRIPNRSLRPDVDERLWLLLQSMVAANPNDRPRSMLEIRDALSVYRNTNALFALVNLCQQKRLMPRAIDEPVFVAQLVAALPGHSSGAPPVPPPANSLNDWQSHEQRSRLHPWLVVGVLSSLFGFLIAAFGVGMQVAYWLNAASQQELANRPLSSTDTHSTTVTPRLDGNSAGTQTENEDGSASDALTSERDNRLNEASERPEVARPIRGDRVIEMLGAAIEVGDTAHLFSRRESFTIEVWVKQTDEAGRLPHGTQLMGARGDAFSVGPFSGGWSLGIDTLGLRPRWRLEVGGRDIARPTSFDGVSFVPNHWHHLALCHQNGNWTIWLDGRRELAAFETGIDRGVSNTGNLRIGSVNFAAAGPTSGFQGWLGGIRISDGIRFTEAFEPEFPLRVDNETLCLIDGDTQTENSEQLRDRSPHARDAQLTGGRIVTLP